MLIRRVPSLPSWNPTYREMDEMRREMDRLLASFADSGGTQSAGVFPAIHVSETPDAVVVRAEIPGIKPADLDIKVEANTLTIAGERESQEDGSASYHRRERGWGGFRRSFSLPTRIDADGVEARYVHGILTVLLPKTAEARPKRIAVQTGA